MSISPRKHSPAPLASSNKPERFLRVYQYDHDRHLSSAISPSKSLSPASNVNTNGQAPFENAPHLPGPIFAQTSPPGLLSRLRKASSSSQLDADAGCMAFENGRMSQDDGLLYAVGANSKERNSQNFGVRPRMGGPSSPKQRQEKPISTGPDPGAGETETELDEPVSHVAV